MVLFWLMAAVLAAATALLIAARAAAAARRAASGTDDPALRLHRRQLGELDDLAARGLLGAAELVAARAEAGRRLLSAADRPGAGLRPQTRGSRFVVTAVAALAALGALGLYLGVGSAGLPDQPYRARLHAWRHADPATLDPAQMAAVLVEIARTRPTDPKVFDYLGRAQLAAHAPGEAARAFAHAAVLAPGDADFPAQEGEALTVGAEGRVPPEAEAAFREALRRDPKSPSARYHLAELKMSRGDVAGGLADWRALAAGLPPGDGRRLALEAQIAQASAPAGAQAPLQGGPSDNQVMAAAKIMPAAGPEQAAFIHGMVDRLAAELKARPDDVDGWARLVRAYRVLGDRPAELDALTEAHAHFSRRPADMARIEAER